MSTQNLPIFQNSKTYIKKTSVLCHTKLTYFSGIWHIDLKGTYAPKGHKMKNTLKLDIPVTMLQVGMFLDTSSTQHGYGHQEVLEVINSTHPDYINITVPLPWEDVPAYCEEWDCKHVTQLTVLKTSRVQVFLNPHYRDENVFHLCGFEEE